MSNYNLVLPNVPATTHYIQFLKDCLKCHETSGNEYIENRKALESIPELRVNYNHFFYLTSLQHTYKQEEQYLFGALYAGLMIYPQLWNSSSSALYSLILFSVHKYSITSNGAQEFLNGLLDGLDFYIPEISKSRSKRKYTISQNEISIELVLSEERMLHTLRNHSKTTHFNFSLANIL